MCLLHRSYTCGCHLQKKKGENLSPLIENYILFYSFCSKIFKFSNGRIRYIKFKSKISILEKDNSVDV